MLPVITSKSCFIQIESSSKFFNLKSILKEYDEKNPAARREYVESFDSEKNPNDRKTVFNTATSQTVQVDGIDTTKTPLTAKFPWNGEEICLSDYYGKKYNVKLQQDQPLFF